LVTVFYKVFNEADFLQESLTTIYPFADKIVVMEYCLESMRKIILPSRVTESGLSVDGTTEIIENFPDPDKKIEYKKIGFLYGGEEIPYQMIVDNIELGDFAWVIDGDIVYDSKFASQICNDIKSNQYDVLWVPEVVFYHDLWHERSCFFTQHQRVFRKQSLQSFYVPGCFEVWWIDQNEDGLFSYRRINEDNKVYQDRRHLGKIYDREDGYRHLKGKTYDREEGFAFHYSYVRSIQRVLEKVLWQYEMIDRGWNNKAERRSCAFFGNPLDFKLQGADFFKAHEMDLTARYDGKHPEIMKNNKWYDYRWDELPIDITYNQAKDLIGWIGEC